MQNSDDKITLCAKVINDGGVVICPTEGIYGFSASINNDKAILRIIDIKKRDEKKGLIVVSSSFEMLDGLIEINKLPPFIINNIKSSWPGHHTWILPCTDKVSQILTGGRNSIAVRVSAFDTLKKLCDKVGSPIVSTSANISGYDPINTIEALHKSFGSDVDYILDMPCGGALKASTIHDALTNTIIRA